MEITSIEPIPVEMGVKPLRDETGLAPYVSSDRGRNIDTADHYEVHTRKRMLVRLETDEDVTGWGELLVTLKSVDATEAIVRDVVAPNLLGREVWEIEPFVSSFYHPYVRIPAVIGGVEMAMWDALGKSLGAPLHQLLGGRTVDRVDLAYCVGILSPEDSRVHSERALKMGFDVVKTKAGYRWREDVERIAAMDEAADGRLEFRVDPNQAFSVGDAVRFCAALEDRGIYLQYLEQPVRTESVGAMKRLRQRTRTPIAANEDAYFAGNLYTLLWEDAIDVAVVDLVPAGGILALQRLVGTAREAGVAVSHHNGFDLGIKQAAVLHAVAATDGITLPPDTIYYAWEDDVLETPLELVDGAMAVPDGPGLGVTVDEAKVEQYRIDR
jgi:L-alanine-DL-glutamate epimerase-like enolase superfamily enzyme